MTAPESRWLGRVETAQDRLCCDHAADDADEAARGETPCKNAVHRDAEAELDDRFHEGCRKTPLEAEADGDHRARQHRKQGDRSAERHFPDLDETEHGTECDHDRADG